MTNCLKGGLLVLFSAFSYAVLALLLYNFKYKTGWEESFILVIRFVLSSFALVIIALKTEQLKNLKTDFPKLSFLGLFYALTSITYYYGVTYLGAMRATAVLFTYPVFMVLVNISLSRRVQLPSIIVAVLSVLGAVLTLDSSLNFIFESVEASGFLLVILAAPLFYVGYILLIERFKTGNHLNEMSIIFLIAGVTILPICLNQNAFMPLSSILNFKWELLCLVFFTITSALSFIKGMKYINAESAGIVASLEPGITLTLVYLGQSQTSTTVQILGVVLIILANILMIKGQKRQILA